MTKHLEGTKRAIYRNLLIGLGLLNDGRTIRYSALVPMSRWGEAIAFLLAEKGWSQKQLADAASVRPNTLTNLIKHGRDSDTATLMRIASALKVDIGDLFLTREQIQILRAYRESQVERLRDTVFKELSATVTRLVRDELDAAANAVAPPQSPASSRRGPRRRRPR